MIKLFRLLINFGKYPIKLGESDNETCELNLYLFTNIRCLVAVLEFNIMYPETRKILVAKRDEDLRKQKGLKLVSMFGFGSKSAMPLNDARK